MQDFVVADFCADLIIAKLTNLYQSDGLSNLYS